MPTSCQFFDSVDSFCYDCVSMWQNKVLIKIQSQQHDSKLYWKDSNMLENHIISCPVIWIKLPDEHIYAVIETELLFVQWQQQ